MNKQNIFKRISYKRRGDVINIKLRDSAWNTFFESEANINDKKDMRRLAEDLKLKGVSFPSGWFD